MKELLGLRHEYREAVESGFTGTFAEFADVFYTYDARDAADMMNDYLPNL